MQDRILLLDTENTEVEVKSKNCAFRLSARRRSK